MATIRCKGCGAFYRYEKEGCCPRCGAYNRPPVREKVDADGTVRHMSDDAFARHGGGSDKVCFETKECHEEQARQYRAPKTAAPAQIAPSGGKKQAKPPSLGTVILVVMVVIIATSVSQMLSDSDESYSDEPEQETEYLEELPYGRWQEPDCDVEAVMGQTVTLEGGAVFTVTGIEWDQQQGLYTIFTEETEAAFEGLYPEGLYCQRDGDCFVVFCLAYEGGGYRFFTGDPLLLPSHVVFDYDAPEGAVQRVRVALTVQDPD